MNFDFNQFVQTITATGLVVAGLVFVLKALLNHLLARDIERRKLELNAEVQQQVSRKDRIREEILRWANPVLGTVTDLERRLHSILYGDGYLALSRESEKRVDPDWSISYGYFMQSTLYLFAQYFCCVRLLQLRLSFELFESQQEKNRFFDAIRQVEKALEGYPAPQFDGKGHDRQVFSLQQRALGEALSLFRDKQAGCMGYHEFVRQLNDPALRDELEPLRNFLEDLSPEEERRWKRLKAVHWHLQGLKRVCEELLQMQSGVSLYLSGPP